MNILILGSGGREHAIGLKIKEDDPKTEIFFAPGNGGTIGIGKNIELDINDEKNIIEFCIQRNIELVIVGPEQPLVNGLSDKLRKSKIVVFGPNKNAARIEGDKSFAKDLMLQYSVPTAEYKTFGKNDFNNALEFVKNGNFPVVIKAAGLAAGKGVIIAKDISEAEEALTDIMMNSIFGNAGDKVVIEEFLDGEELSVFVITDGSDYVILPPAQDHKRIGDGDTGKNTGGMGAYTPVPFVSDELIFEIEKNVIIPTLKGLQDTDSKFNGCLYCGLIKTKNGIKVIEFNCRFGDPETQAVLELIEGNFLELLHSTAKGKVNKNSVKNNNGSAVCIVAVSGGYPDKYEKGFEISGLDQKFENNVKIIHAGTKFENGKILTTGGRVLNIVASINKNDLKQCKTIAYDALRKVDFEKIFYRKDIGFKAIN